jgi:PAS domain S-box-containing protein
MISHYPSLRIIATSLRLLASRTAVVALALVAIAAVWIAALQAVQISRDRELQAAGKEAANYARAFEEHIVRTIESVDTVVLDVIQELGRAGLPATRRDLARLHEIHRDVILVIAVIDARGDIIANSMPTPVISVADLPHFRAHVERDTGKLFLGKPLLGRVSKKWSMHLSRRVNAADGSFAGIVTAAISLDYLRGFYQSVSLGKQGMIQLIGDDGIVRVRSSDEGITAGQDASGMHLFQELRGGSRLGTYGEVSPFDEVRRIVSYRVVEGHPLVVAVSVGEAEVLTNAQAIARHYYLGAGGITLLVVVMLAATALLLSRQRRIGRALEQSEQRLSLAQEGSEQALFDWNIVTGEVYLSERWNEMMGGERKPVRTSFDELAKLVHPDDLEGQRTSILEALKEDAPYRREHRIRTREGGWIWIQSHGKVTARDARGRALRLVGYNADITARKVSQLALADSERSYANLVRNISGVVYRCRNDLDWTIEFISERCLDVTGYRTDEFLRNRLASLGSIMHPDDAGPIWQKCQASLAERKACSNEYRIIHRSGEIRWVWDQAQGVYSDSGELLFIEGLLSDITERKRAEAEMTREQGLLRTIIDTVPDYIYVKDADGRFSVANKAWLRDRNLTDKSVAGKTVFDFFPAELANRMAAQDAGIVATGTPILDFEQRVTVQAPEGGLSEPHWFAVTKVPMADASGKIIGTVGISRDITERKLSAQRREMEHAVTQLLAESASVEEAMPRFLRTMCQAMNWSYGARWVCNSEGIRRADYWADFEPEFDPADGELWLRQGVEGSMVLLRQAWQHKEPTWIVDIDQLETFRRRVSARKFGLHGAFAFPIVVGGDVIGIMEFFGHEAREPDEMLLQGVRAIGSQLGQFIQRKEAEQALRESEKQFKQLAGNIPQVFWICDAHRHSAIYVSPAFREITGLDPGNLKVRAHGWLDAVHPDDRQQVVVARTQAGTGKYDQTFRIVKPDGSVRWVRDRAFPVYDERCRLPHSGDLRGHHGEESRRGAARPARALRHPDRPAQPSVIPGPRAAGDDAGATPRPGNSCDVPRSRPLQAHQRYARARRRRSASETGGRASRRLHTRGRYGGPLRWRRVRDRSRRHAQSGGRPPGGPEGARRSSISV